MNKGIVKWFNGQKGYGFIHDESGIDLFVHYSDLNMVGYKALDEGQPQRFNPIPAPPLERLRALSTR